MRPDELQIIGGPKSLNTTRTEIAPGSDVVRKDFECDWLCHINALWFVWFHSSSLLKTWLTTPWRQQKIMALPSVPCWVLLQLASAILN